MKKPALAVRRAGGVDLRWIDERYEPPRTAVLQQQHIARSFKYIMLAEHIALPVILKRESHSVAPEP